MSFTVLNNNNKDKNKEVTKTWLAGQRSCTLVIPKDFAKRYGLDEPSHVIIEGTSHGILIKKLEFNGDNATDETLKI